MVLLIFSLLVDSYFILIHKLKKMIFLRFLLFIGLILGSSCNSLTDTAKLSLQDLKISEDIRINQIGYYPNALKKAVVTAATTTNLFHLIDATGKIVLEKKLSETKEWLLAGENVRIADFSSITQEGTYYLVVEGIGKSYPFKIKKTVLKEAFLGSIKGLYYQRMSMPLDKKHAGKWHRAMAHPDTSVLFHPSSGRQAGANAAPKGWYDAGDYNKYVINASFPLGQFYSLEEQYPNCVEDNSLNIPESGNGLSDYLDELKYEMDWVLTMQDTDGGMFHKLTTKKFEPMVMPIEAVSQRYIVGKGTAATLDFAATAAKAYRVYQKYDPVYGKQCLSAAKSAYQWAVKNPNKEFKNPEDISTGQYGDKDFTDEWFWANAELFVSTKEQLYLNEIQNASINLQFNPGESWTEYMQFLGVFTLLEHKEMLSEAFYTLLRTGVLSSAEALINKSNKGAYFQPVEDFHWGSNSDILNAAMIMAQAYRLTGDKNYLIGVQQAADYIFGVNAVGVSFLTGFGTKQPMFIHHRQSAADEIAAPVPGLLSGGPNSRQQDTKHGTKYPPNVPPMKSWVDQESSYASNEVCLNWNAPMTYILGFLEQESN